MVLLGGTANAFAQPSDAESEAVEPLEDPAAAEARALFDRAHQLAGASRFSEAAQAFSRSLELVDRPSTAFNLGICYFALDRHVQAIEVLTRFVDAADASEEAESIADAQRMLTHARASVATIVIEVLPSDATVLLDGEPALGAATRTFTVNPGPHVLRVEARHHAPVLLELSSEPGGEQRRAIQLVSTRRPATLSVAVPGRALAVISLDGVEIGLGGATLELDAGTHQLSVRESDGEPIVRRLELAWNERLQVQLFLPDPTPSSVFDEPVFWGVLGAGVGAVALSVLVGVLVSEVRPGVDGGTTGEVVVFSPTPELEFP